MQSIAHPGGSATIRSSRPVWAIAACGTNGVIGAAGGLPWKIAEDWAYLLDMVKGGIVIVGRRCCASHQRLFSKANGNTIAFELRLPLHYMLRSTSSTRALESSSFPGS